MNYVYFTLFFNLLPSFLIPLDRIKYQAYSHDHHRHRPHHHHVHQKLCYMPIVLCPPFPVHMPRYLGVRSRIQKGRRIWAARAYGTELGCALADDKAGEIVRKMGEVASIQSLVIRSTVLSPKSVARYEGVCYRKPGKKPRGMVGGQEALIQRFSRRNCSH